jgi:hypothetical protein
MLAHMSASYQHCWRAIAISKCVEGPVGLMAEPYALR